MQRDAHGGALVRSGGVSYIHQADRVQDTVDVFDITNSPVNTLTPISKYSLRSSGVCGTTAGVPLVNNVPLTNKVSEDVSTIIIVSLYLF